MFSTVLIGTDLSEASDRVIGCLQGLKGLGTRKVILLHALGLKHLDAMRPLLAERVEPKLSSQQQAVKQQGFEVKVEIATGLPIPAITDTALERKVSMIMVGSHGATLFRDALLGGVATGVVHQATVPVLVMEMRLLEEDGSTRCELICKDIRERLMFATDFSDTAERAFTYVEEIVKAGARQVILIHVQDKAHIGKHLEDRLDEFNRTDQARLERLKERLVQKGAADVRIELPYGSPIQEILKISKSQQPSLVVMGSQGRGFIREIFLGSVSHAVVRHSDVPVLLIPAVR
jgi:nucleotide-binding universal stress UspA family protein